MYICKLLFFTSFSSRVASSFAAFSYSTEVLWITNGLGALTFKERDECQLRVAEKRRGDFQKILLLQEEGAPSELARKNLRGWNAVSLCNDQCFITRAHFSERSVRVFYQNLIKTILSLDRNIGGTKTNSILDHPIHFMKYIHEISIAYEF